MSHYIAVTAADKAGKYAYTIRVTDQDNIASILRRISGLQWVSICKTHKAAEELVTMHNRSYKALGCYRYQYPAF